MQTSVKRGEEKTLKKDQGSAMKKTSVKNTSVSIVKKKAATKLPDFKKIHQRLFNNMESLGEHLKRHQDRAWGLLQSPIVPRCAMLSPKPSTAGNAESSPQSKAQNTKVKTLVEHMPLAAKLKTPAASRTPIAARNPAPVASSMNRLGFRKPVRKEEESESLGKSCPKSIWKKKTEDLNVLKGVRVNNCFLLQMEMRQKSGQ